MRRLTSRPIAAASPEGRSGVISLTSLKNRCKLGAPRSAGRDRSQCSRRARVVRLGTAPFKKFLSALGLSPISRAARRKERFASSRSTAARRAGMGRTKDAAPGRRGAALTGVPKPAQFVQLSSPYTGNPTIRAATRQVGSAPFAHPPGTGRPKRRRCWRIASFWCVNSRTLVRGYALQSNTKPAARSSG